MLRYCFSALAIFPFLLSSCWAFASELHAHHEWIEWWQASFPSDFFLWAGVVLLLEILCIEIGCHIFWDVKLYFPYSDLEILSVFCSSLYVNGGIFWWIYINGIFSFFLFLFGKYLAIFALSFLVPWVTSLLPRTNIGTLLLPSYKAWNSFDAIVLLGLWEVHCCISSPKYFFWIFVGY